ncbi:hypothetical protein V2G26_014439 [Clonostachys chloroleuca]
MAHGRGVLASGVGKTCCWALQPSKKDFRPHQRYYSCAIDPDWHARLILWLGGESERRRQHKTYLRIECRDSQST